MRRGWWAAVVAVGLAAGGSASAHQFDCEKRVNGQQVATLNQYPATVRFDYRLTNTHPSHASVARKVVDPVLAGRGWSFPHTLPLTVPVGGRVEMEFTLEVGSYEECQTLAAQDGSDDSVLDTAFKVMWLLGEDQCTARLICQPPVAPPPPRDCRVTNTCSELLVTRDEGFFKIHESALQQCVDTGPIELGTLGTVATLPDALGLLWANLNEHPNHTPRSPTDQKRLLLARQLLVAHCNGFVLATFPVEPTIMDEARAALSGGKCARLTSLTHRLRTHNEAGREQPLPEDFDPGQPTPGHAEGIAHDFTQPSGYVCQGG
jgi:hypothetical protein